jgi:hypothetical protein
MILTSGRPSQGVLHLIPASAHVPLAALPFRSPLARRVTKLSTILLASIEIRVVIVLVTSGLIEGSRPILF